MTDRIEWVRSLYEAFARGEIETVLAAFDPGIEWNEAEHVSFDAGHPFHGPDEVQGLFAHIPEAFADTFRIAIDRIHQCGDTVFMEGRYSGTVQSTGRRLDAQVAHVWDLDGERIVRFQQYTDTWQFAEVTGITPVRPLAGAATA